MNMYNPENQYRCTIIRGKSQEEMEDLLPFYAQTVHRNCPCTKAEFDERCNSKLSESFFGINDFNALPKHNRKTVRNHITEVMGKLLGLYYLDDEGYVKESESCKHLNKHQDFPTFFKNLCFNLQFPNGASSSNYLRQHIEDSLWIRPLCYVVALLLHARNQGYDSLSKQEIGYYCLNNLDVLRGTTSVELVFQRIMADRKAKNDIPILSGSRDWQHIKEMLNLLELSNVCSSDRAYIWLNPEEQTAIDLFSNNTKPSFDIFAFDSSSTEGITELKRQWQEHYGKMDKNIASLESLFSSEMAELATANRPDEARTAKMSTSELGDLGEALVYKMELSRIRAYKERWGNKVLWLGKTKGLGYDICSLEADENPLHPEFARYIEVKSTRRVTRPSFDNCWNDTVRLTSKEWVAAQQYGEYYNIYRVYFTRQGVVIARINDPFKKNQEGVIDVFPTVYQMDFSSKAIIELHSEEGVGR